MLCFRLSILFNVLFFFHFLLFPFSQFFSLLNPSHFPLVIFLAFHQITSLFCGYFFLLFHYFNSFAFFTCFLHHSIFSCKSIHTSITANVYSENYLFSHFSNYITLFNISFIIPFRLNYYFTNVQIFFACFVHSSSIFSPPCHLKICSLFQLSLTKCLSFLLI